MDNLTKFWLADLIGAPIIIALIFILISFLSLVWALALKTFKKFPWNYLWIFTVSFFIAAKTVWYDFPRVWLGEFKERKNKLKGE